MCEGKKSGVGSPPSKRRWLGGCVSVVFPPGTAERNFSFESLSLSLGSGLGRPAAAAVSGLRLRSMLLSMELYEYVHLVSSFIVLPYRTLLHSGGPAARCRKSMHNTQYRTGTCTACGNPTVESVHVLMKTVG